MIPYLAGYLRVKSPSGRCVEVFNTCRTIANFHKPGRAAGWEIEASEKVWDGYCNWAWDEGPYEDEANPDPWHDPADPATREVAGFLVDPPDSDGHGFYLEPSGAKRIVEANRFEPLEMYFTGSIISCTSRGEAALLKWMDKTLRNCSASCGGWEATVFGFYPCEDDFVEAVFTGNGDQLVPATVNTGEPVRPDLKCGEAEVLTPGGDPAPYLDTGMRAVRKLVYRGFEQLDEGLDECYGNRYKFCFDVYDHCWTKPGLKVAEFSSGWDRCRCVCTNRYEICRWEEQIACPEIPDSSVKVTAPIVRTGSRPSTDNRNGLIALPNRYVRPDKVNVKSVLTPVMRAGNWVPRINIRNDEGDSFNVRVSIWKALNHVPPPDTEEGWCIYRGLEPCWGADIHVLRNRQTICFNTDGSCEITCTDGTVVDGSKTVDKRGEFLDCPGRFWITFEVCCDEPNDFTAEVFLHEVESI